MELYDCLSAGSTTDTTSATRGRDKDTCVGLDTWSSRWSVLIAIKKRGGVKDGCDN